MKISKGKPGYIKSKKTRYLLYAIIEFLVVFGLIAIGIITTGSKKNLLTVVAVVGCLPACKMLVEFITMLPYHSLPDERVKELKDKAPLVIKAYDMIITNKESVMPLDVLFVCGNTLCGYTSSDKTDEKILTDYLKELVAGGGYEKMTVKIFKDYNSFLTRIEGMNSIVSVDKKSGYRREKDIIRLILSSSM